MSEPRYAPVPLDFERLVPVDQRERLRDFSARMEKRRTVRQYSSEPVPIDLIEGAIAVASRAPSGANMQPWRFVVVSEPEVKRRIREAAEAEERDSYERRMPPDWIDALAPLGTDWQKEFLETAPHLIVVFSEGHHLRREQDGITRRVKHYYVMESVGIACGFLLVALHVAGLATLTHTPSPMGFLSAILGRPSSERPYLLIPVGYPAKDAVVPDIPRKSLDEVMIRY